MSGVVMGPDSSFMRWVTSRAPGKQPASRLNAQPEGTLKELSLD